ncbi:MAG: Unknown protein [uncultured Sulfurovum sp.]|uniref:Uncharacterized protein n=1 Tax=uncultured Sulfurovum sp. TaxID=269237 RepID=A0A6S6U3S1_9BACT|nr:MAG: Unknown protein [uncultured Sulfurovum sp.]
MKKIKAQLISQYGIPDEISHYEYGSYNYEFSAEYFCWGSCEVEKAERSHQRGSSINTKGLGQSLIIKYTHNANEDIYLIDFELLDRKLENITYKWEEEEYKKAEKNLREKESNLDL